MKRCCACDLNALASFMRLFIKGEISMRMYDLITKKKHGEALTNEEIKFMVEGYVKGEIPDYQMSSMLMAIWFKGMNDEEITELTMNMAKSGDMIDLSAIEGLKVDKHSTGGVGDKTTLVVSPIVAACGGKVAKMSGRGLGHTGGTVDKLEAIPGYRTTLDRKEFFDTVNKCGMSLIGQSGNLAPADKKLYALRDVTATVDSIPLIASSIMSKKLAAGSDCILLDVKTGSGAFMKTLDDSIKLAQTMVAIGEGAGRRTVALITDMDTPLGYGIGNSLEGRGRRPPHRGAHHRYGHAAGLWHRQQPGSHGVHGCAQGQGPQGPHGSLPAAGCQYALSHRCA